MTSAVLNFDSAALLFIQENLRSDFLTPVMTFITRLGDAGFIWILLGIVLLFPPKTRRGGFDMIICLAAAFVLTDIVLKDLIGRIRPYEVIEGLKLLVAPETSFSFPSGHTSASFACATALTLSFGKKGAWSFVLAALIALSRLYVGVHYPTDVLGGIVVGTLAAVGAYYLLKRFVKTDFVRKDSI